MLSSAERRQKRLWIDVRNAMKAVKKQEKLSSRIPKPQIVRFIDCPSFLNRRKRVKDPPKDMQTKTRTEINFNLFESEGDNE